MTTELKGRPTMSSLREEQIKLLEMTQVTKTYQVGGQTVRALDSIDLTLHGGEFVSIVGPSGAGKSTLLHMLGALDRPDSGSIRFQGPNGLARDLRPQRREAVRIPSTQCGIRLPVLQSASDDDRLGERRGAKAARWRTDAKVKSHASDLLALVGLAERAEHRPSELSGGQMQRVAVARALMMDPPLILADEPTGNLDTKTGAAIMGLLTDIAHQDGRSVVMVTHDLDAASSTDRVITLTDGRIGSDVLAGELR